MKNLPAAIEMIRKEQLELVAQFEEHYRHGLATTDHYLAENDDDEWFEQFESFVAFKNGDS